MVVQEGMADYVHFCLICKNMHLDNLNQLPSEKYA